MSPWIGPVHHNPELELKVLQDYGWAPSEEVLWANFYEKIFRPTSRDVATLKYHQASCGILHRHIKGHSWKS